MIFLKLIEENVCILDIDYSPENALNKQNVVQ